MQLDDSRARKNHTTVLQRLASVGQVNVAGSMDVSEAVVSRMKNDGGLETYCRLLAACGLKVVPVTMLCYEREVIGAIFVLARRNLDQITDPHTQLSWSD